jgi:hypothetical protein
VDIVCREDRGGAHDGEEIERTRVSNDKVSLRYLGRLLENPQGWVVAGLPLGLNIDGVALNTLSLITAETRLRTAEFHQGFL